MKKKKRLHRRISLQWKRDSTYTLTPIFCDSWCLGSWNSRRTSSNNTSSWCWNWDYFLNGFTCTPILLSYNRFLCLFFCCFSFRSFLFLLLLWVSVKIFILVWIKRSTNKISATNCMPITCRRINPALHPIPMGLFAK